MFKRIDHVEIVTDQLDQTVQFYTEVLGFTVKAQDRIERLVAYELSVWNL
jgi:catechol 2,3-dioxygenase-like lactoylglutathione lyase family enzyme